MPRRAASSTEVPADLQRVAERLRPLGSVTRLHLLRFLTKPHYLEEIASFLKMNRFAAKRHVDELVAIGLLRSVPGVRDSGPVRDYIVAPEAIFELYDAVRTLGEIRPAPDAFGETAPAVVSRTRAGASPRGGSRQATPFPYFVVVYGPEIGHAYPLAPRRDGRAHWRIGRDAASEVPLADPFVSNRHARVTRDGEDFVLTDAFSANGTWVNWERIPEGESEPLRHGDLVGAGKTLLLFRRDAPPG